MRDKKFRNLKILEMKIRGLSYGEIAHIFDISRDRVRQVLQELDFEEKRKQRAQKIFQDIKSSNNIEKEWPIGVIIEGLVLPKTVTWRLVRYFEAEDVFQLTLKDFMDLLIVDNDRVPKDFREAFPICNGSRIGPWTHSVIVNYVSRQDLGATWNKEWSNRLEKLRIYLKQSRKQMPLFLHKYSYSFIELGGEKPFSYLSS